MSAFAFVLLLSYSARALPEEDLAQLSDIRLPDAQQVMDEVLNALPREPLLIDAQLITRSFLHNKSSSINVQVALDWRLNSGTASYTLRDAFGKDRERMTVLLDQNKSLRYLYDKGDPLISAEPPELFTRIEGSYFSWMDLSLSFLWWTNGEVVGTEKITGRTCYIIDVPAPEKEHSPYQGVRLWIDPKIHVLLQAEAYFDDGQLARRLLVKSFRKIDDVWMIKDLDVYVYPEKKRSRLRVRSVEKMDTVPEENSLNPEVTPKR